MNSSQEWDFDDIDKELLSTIGQLLSQQNTNVVSIVRRFEDLQNRTKYAGPPNTNPRLQLCQQILKELQKQDPLRMSNRLYNGVSHEDKVESDLQQQLNRQDMILKDLTSKGTTSKTREYQKNWDRRDAIVTELKQLRDSKSLFDRLRWVENEHQRAPSSPLAPSDLVDGIKFRIEQLCWVDGMEGSNIYTKDAIHQLVYPPVVSSPVQYNINNSNSGMQLPNFNSNGVSSSKNGSKLGISSNAVVVDPAVAAFENIFGSGALNNEDTMIDSCASFIRKCVISKHYSEEEAQLVIDKLKASGANKFQALQAAISSTNKNNSAHTLAVKNARNEFVHLLFPYDDVATEDKEKRDTFLQKNKVFLEQIRLKGKEIGGRYSVGSEVNNNNTSHSSGQFTSKPISSEENVNGSPVVNSQVSSLPLTDEDLKLFPSTPQGENVNSLDSINGTGAKIANNIPSSGSSITASSPAATNLAQPSATDFKDKVINLVVSFITSNDNAETLASKLEKLKNEVTATNAKSAQNNMLLDFDYEESSDSQKKLSESDEKLYQSILENQEEIQNIHQFLKYFNPKDSNIENAKKIAALLFYSKDTSATTFLEAEALENSWLESQEGKGIYDKFSVSIDAHIQPKNPVPNKPPKPRNNDASNRKSETSNPGVDLNNNNNVQSAQNSSSSNQSQDIKPLLISLCKAETDRRPLFQHFSTLLAHNEQCSLNERGFIESEISFKSVKPLLNSNSTVSNVIPKYPPDSLQGNATLLAKAYPTAAGTASNDAPLSQVAVKLVAAKGGVSNITEEDQYDKLDGDSKHQVAMELAILYMTKCYRPGQIITIEKGSDEEKLRVYAAVHALITVKHELDSHNVGTINVVSEVGTVQAKAKENAVAGFNTWLGQQGEKYTAYLEQLKEPKQTTASKLKSFLSKNQVPVQLNQNQSVEITPEPRVP